MIENGLRTAEGVLGHGESGSGDDPAVEGPRRGRRRRQQTAGCVTSYLPSTGTGAITQVNGAPSTPEARWKVGIDGGALATAERGTTIHVGDTIYLKFE